MTIVIEKYSLPIVTGSIVWNLIKYGYEGHVHHDTDVDKICADIFSYTDDLYGLYLGVEDGKPKGFFILILTPTGPCRLTPFSNMPYVAMLYNGSGPDMLKALTEGIKITVRDKLNKVFFMAINDKPPDTVWERTLKNMGVPQRGGSIYFWDVRK